MKWPELLADVRSGRLTPYLGPGLTALAIGDMASDIAPPDGPGALATFFERHVALPRRARGNPWAAAQYIESKRHRRTLTDLMSRAFEVPVVPSPLHRILAACAPRLIVDTWYDGAMRQALTEAFTPSSPYSWGEVQGTPRAGVGEVRWYRAYDRQGEQCPIESANDWTTLLYKPHGGVVPARHYLVADSDYVEVLTEIDIQTPIPDIVRTRRTDVGFLFLGCRFDDQLMRNYARQILKRSAGPHYAVLPKEGLTRNEERFIETLGITPLDLSLAQIGDDGLAPPEQRLGT